MQLNYIYTSEGKIEYVIAPVKLWEKVEKYAQEESDDLSYTSSFNPANFREIISFKKIDIETELRNLRNQWNIDF